MQLTVKGPCARLHAYVDLSRCSCHLKLSPVPASNSGEPLLGHYSLNSVNSQDMPRKSVLPFSLLGSLQSLVSPYLLRFTWFSCSSPNGALSFWIVFPSVSRSRIWMTSTLQDILRRSTFNSHHMASDLLTVFYLLFLDLFVPTSPHLVTLFPVSVSHVRSISRQTRQNSVVMVLWLLQMPPMGPWMTLIPTCLHDCAELWFSSLWIPIIFGPELQRSAVI